MSYKAYLQTKIKHPTGLGDYQHYQDHFVKWLESENLTVETCEYVDLLSYVKLLKQKERSTHTLNSYIRGVKYYYEYLQGRNEITRNPARRLYIKGDTYQLPSDLLNKKELNTIYVDYPTETIVQKRNKTLLGLAIYQAMRLDELEAIEPGDIDLHKGTVYIKKTGRAMKRTLKLEAHQILPLQEYIKEILPQLREKSPIKSEKLIFSTGSNPGIKEMVCDLNKQLRKRYPRYKNLMHIRSSVIALWIEQKNIIEVQYMAGHNNINSTERYKRVSMQDLKKSLDQFHPLR
ncbi:site-specific integrase [Reichenbachiella carrageenanivorans]|uniref:Site-specific integrase n=1 Tax=Reichenbachiella carrageenanivorans TaxID=2979869 RepID=A0ABY6CZU7_9BACT|nr:site-specific integrase [Reichenbachiella carrageenanivorans]UXX79435.1 site-specific integrase [Reichenbachiella carrageenanivorans]UXX79441.1 site-specific integrase [Reichenbachiella carrageenanivorans]